MALTKAGLQVDVISPRRVSLRELFRGRTSLTTVPELRESRRAYVGPPRMPWLDEVVWRGIARKLYSGYLAKYGPPDILHAHSMCPAGMLAAELPARARVLTEHLSTFLGPDGPRLGARLSPQMNRFAARIGVGPGITATMERIAGSGGPWICIPNLVDTEFFKPARPPSRVIRVLTVSNLTPNKRVDWVIRAFDRSFEKSNAELCIIGDGAERGRLERQAAQLESASRIRFLGSQSRAQVRAHLDQCTIFALASRHETLGVVLLEAMAMGRPVIATNSGGPASTVTDDVGILVEVNDFSAFAEGMRRLVSQSDTYDPDSIRRYCQRRFGEQAVTTQLIAVYEEALRNV